MEEQQRQGDQETVNTIPTPLPFTDRSSNEESDVEEAEETEQQHQLDEEQKVSDNTPPIHVCEHCGKQFGSGKALGGHKRIHFQSAKRDLRKKNKKIQSTEGDHDNAIRGCSICGKIFRSVKALYGHLRLHPDRPWRGAANQQSSSPLRYESRPNPNPSCPIEPKLEDLDKPKMVNLPNYPRITLSVDMSSWTTSAPDSSSRMEEQDTAGILLLLSCETPFNEDKAKKRRAIDPEEEKKTKKLSELHGNIADQENRVSSSNSKEKKVYICYPCNKSFNSHQAYGGHVSSHNKLSSKTHSSSSPTMVSTPQSTSRSETGPSNESPLNRPRSLDIDLNEPPPPEDEDEGQC